MISTSHLLIGAATGAATGNPAGAFFVGVASHFAMDMVPHVDIGTFISPQRKNNLNFNKSEYVEAFADIIIGGAVVLLLIFKSSHFNAVNMFWGAAGGISVDVIDNVPFWSNYTRELPIFKSMHNLHSKLHFNIDSKYWYLGTLTQVLFAGGSLFYLLKLSGII